MLTIKKLVRVTDELIAKEIWSYANIMIFGQRVLLKLVSGFAKAMRDLSFTAVSTAKNMMS